MSEKSIGERLREAREAIPASLVEASRATRVRVDFLEAMERDSFNFISGRVYVVGMLRSYSRWLRLDEHEMAAQFDRIHGAPAAPLLGESLAPRDEPRMLSAKPRKPPWAIVGAAAGGLIVVLLVVSFIRGGSNVAQPPAPPLSPSPSPVPAVTSTGVPATETATEPPGVNLIVSAIKGSSFMHVIVGDTVPALVTFDGTLRQGVTQTFSAPDVLRVDFGNMGAVNLQVNGKAVGTPGALGKNGAFSIAPDGTLTPDNSALATPGSSPPPSPPPSPRVHTSPSPRVLPSQSPGLPASPPASPSPSTATSPHPVVTTPGVSPSP
ncbi:MAG: helix-turn-helix domain-containing protein [Actinomycetota bacterium]